MANSSRKSLIDEDFRTISLQVLGKSTKPWIGRPTTYGDVSYTPESAPWFSLVSMHYAPASPRLLASPVEKREKCATDSLRNTVYSRTCPEDPELLVKAQMRKGSSEVVGMRRKDYSGTPHL